MPKTPGHSAFDGYNNHGPNAGKTHDGKDVPPWENLGDITRERWEAGARSAIRDRFAYSAGRLTDEQLKDAFGRAVVRFSAECMMHNGPLSLHTLIEIFESELPTL